MEEMWAVIQQQQAEIEALKAQVKSTDEKVEIAGEQIDQVSQAASQSAAADNRTHIGGYGEMHYNNLDSGDKIDFHRFVLFFGHEFNDRIRLFSELEVEHVIASHDEGDPGEVELEQAYVEFDINEHHRAKGGLFLMPVGLLNETHEPTTFYGVERNPVEKDIIPTTWWEGGAALAGQLGNGFGYDLALTSGLKTDDGFKIRDARQQVAEADASDPAVTARVKWTGVPGVELAATVQHQSDVTQSGAGTVKATLIETHAAINKGPFGLRALYARWNLDGAAPEALGRDVQTGWYIEPSYRLNDQWGFFARHNQWDNEAGGSGDTQKRQTDLGVNYWPHEDVVLKFDIQNQSGAVDNDGFNLGIGYQF
jgi:hypothetical protein